MLAVSDLLESLNREFNQLDSRIERLNNFLFSDEFESLPDVSKINLQAQASIMAAYAHVLRARMMEHHFEPTYVKEWRL